MNVFRLTFWFFMWFFMELNAGAGLENLTLRL